MSRKDWVPGSLKISSSRKSKRLRVGGACTSLVFIGLICLAVFLGGCDLFFSQDTHLDEKPPAIPDAKRVATLVPPQAAMGAFGHSVYVNGDHAIVGDPGTTDRTGAAHIFERQGGEWVHVQTLSATDLEVGDQFGWDVAIEADYAVVTAPGKVVDGKAVGAAYIFSQDVNDWEQTTRLGPSDSLDGSRFGESVDLNVDYVHVGAPGVDGERGAVYTYRQIDDRWRDEEKLVVSERSTGARLGSSVSLYQDVILAGAPGPVGTGKGEAHIFNFKSDDWQWQGPLDTGGVLEAGDNFGGSVAVFGVFSLIGAPGINSAQEGDAHLFNRVGSLWRSQNIVHPDGQGPEDEFGHRVAITINFAVITSVKRQGSGWSTGNAYLFRRGAPTESHFRKLPQDPSLEAGTFGFDVSIDRQTLLVGAPNGGSSGSGAAYLYDLPDS